MGEPSVYDGDAGRRGPLNGDPRTAELAGRLEAVRGRIRTAAAAAGRGDRLPTLIVVTKFHPAEDIRRLASLGVTDVGENRDQEAAGKAEILADCGLTWHFVGQLQTKKAKSVVRYAAAVHSVDRPQLVDALAKAVRIQQDSTGRAPLDCFIQVSLEEDAGGVASVLLEVMGGGLQCCQVIGRPAYGTRLGVDHGRRSAQDNDLSWARRRR